MYLLIESLTQAERDVLSSSLTDMVAEYIGPVVRDLASHIGFTTIEGQELNIIKSWDSLERDISYRHKSFINHHGDAVWHDDVLKTLCAFAAKADVSSPKPRVGALPSQNSQGTLAINRPVGTFDLFDAPLAVSNCIEFNIALANLSHSDRDSPVHVSAGLSKIKFQMSPEQFIRFMRSESASIPCTIASKDGVRFDPPSPEFHVQHGIRKNLKKELSVHLAPLKRLESELLALLKTGPFTSKKAVAVVNAKFAEFEALYHALEPALADSKVAASNEIVDDFKSRFIQFAQNEAKKLPPSIRDQLYIPIL